jgi:hypothetical protein
VGEQIRILVGLANELMLLGQRVFADRVTGTTTTALAMAIG